MYGVTTLHRPSKMRSTPTIKENIDLKPFTYFKIGGVARYFAEVTTIDDLREVVKFAKAKGVPFFVFGAASNILVADRGYNGLAIRLMLRDLRREGDSIVAGAGVPNAVAVARAIKEGLGGFEWAIGIPGSIGGSVRGNAGCFSGEMKDVVSKVKVLNIDTGEVEEYDNAFCAFGYRDSVFKHNQKYIVVEATLSLRKGTPETSQKLVRYYTSHRSESQDIGASSAGCVFKNTPWPKDDHARTRLMKFFPGLKEFQNQEVIPAGYIIDHITGLKGKTIGSVSISKRHGNYFINHGGATAEEVIMLIGLVKEYVHRKCGLHLEEEIQYVGFEG